MATTDDIVLEVLEREIARHERTIRSYQPHRDKVAEDLALMDAIINAAREKVTALREAYNEQEAKEVRVQGEERGAEAELRDTPASRKRHVSKWQERADLPVPGH